MSYARFSHSSDVYVYVSWDGGWQIHVAKYRYVNTEPFPTMDGIHPTDTQSYNRRYLEQKTWLESATIEPIGLPYDGESYVEKSPGAAADRLEELRSAGYMVQQYAIDLLRGESLEVKP